MTFKAISVFVLTLMFGSAISGCAAPVGPPSPYEQGGPGLRGVTWEPGADPDAELARMRDEFFVDTVTVYGLQDWAAPRVDLLLAALTRQDIRLVARVEAYEPERFAFTDADAEWVVHRHESLLDQLGKSDRVAYLSVNMPVDDPRVQARLGGVNSALSAHRQTNYAATITRLLRQHTGARIFLSLFYGWDGSYHIPSYQGSGADGYVLTSYSYPGKIIPTVRSKPADLIGEKRLRAIAERAANDHPGRPLVVEYGFQTLAGHPGRPDQTAGLVSDERAKRRALRATTRFYRECCPAVIGTMYFGWNVHKAEGTPPRMIDYGLVPPPMPA